MKYRTWLEINERALAQNIQTLQSLLNPGTRLCAVVKANAYGHGLKEIAHIAARNGVTSFAVDTVEDALFLRSFLPSAMIVVIGYVLREKLEEAVAADLELTVYDKETIRAVEEAAASRAKQARVHLKIETGTTRQGILPDDLSDTLDCIAACPHVTLNGLSTHFANVEDAEDPAYANIQYARFLDAKARVLTRGFSPEHIHCACSAAVIMYPDTQGTLVRAGISFYGLWPSATTERQARAHRLRVDWQPVLSWKTRIAQVKALKAGTPVSYGLTEILTKNSRVAVLPVGYSDGFDRRLSSVGEVLVNGQRCKVLGRVCMNMTMVDVSNVPNAVPEQEVILIGRGGRFELTAEELAQRAGTIHYEMLSRISPALPRVIV